LKDYFPQKSFGHIGWRTLTGYLIFIGNFPQKSPIIGGYFAEDDLHIRASYCLGTLYQNFEN